MKFNSSEEMLEKIRNGFDLFNPESEEYVFCYNEEESICMYHISEDEAIELAQKCLSSKEECWSAFLGHGGQIFDGDDAMTWCEDKWMSESWVRTHNFLA